MSFPSMARLHLPRSLRSQFVLALAVLVLLISASGVTAVYALRITTGAAQTLADEQLTRMQEAQDLVKRTLLIERESYQLEHTQSLAAMRDSYAAIVDQLQAFDRLSDELAANSDDAGVLDLHQSSQLFRNTANVVAQLRENDLQAAAEKRRSADPEDVKGGHDGSDASAQPFYEALHQEAGSMVAVAQAQSDRLTQNYRTALRQLAATSARNQRWVMAFSVGSLLFACLITHSFLGKRVLSRLHQVSLNLRVGEAEGERAAAHVHGNDEIGEMARAVEQFQEDRRQLALSNTALQIEKIRQEELIRKLAEAHSQLLQSEKMASIGQLAAGVAHEINNPIAFVNSNLGTLQHYVADLCKALSAYEQSEKELLPETQSAIDALKQAVDLVYVREDVNQLLTESMDGLQRVKRIVQALRNFSQAEKTEMQYTNLEDELNSLISLIGIDLNEKIALIKEFGSIPEIQCIPAQLSQVFMNLLTNAMQAIDDQGCITLRTGRDPDAVWVEVQDTGSGIAPDNLGRIFDPFFTTKPVGTGPGLGLSISYGIVKRHGGRIDVESAVGKGSTFRVVLPIATVSA